MSNSSLDKPSVIMRFYLQNLARELIPGERVGMCFRYHLPNETTVKVHRSKTAKRAYYGGLMVCGSVWHCPVCAHRIAEQRRQELSEVLNAWTGGLALITYTASHRSTTPLRDILNGIGEGFRSFKSGRKFQSVKDDYGWIGSVRSLEVTYGVNGWHPHVHELVLFTNDLNVAALHGLEVTLKSHWREVLARRGWTASLEHGIDIREADKDIRDYVTKWGHEPSIDNPQFQKRWTLEKELVYANKKKAAKEGRTPLQLLMDYGEGDDGAGWLWQEYAKTFKGRQQLVWSKGLRAFLGMKEPKKDEEVAAEIPDETIIYAELDREQWRKILHGNLRGDILHAASFMDREGFNEYLLQILTT